MSSRRKKTPPVRVDEEKKKKMDWNMLEDRKSEAIPEHDQISTCSVLPVSPNSNSSFLSIPGAAPNTSVQFKEEVPGTSSEGTTASASLSLTVQPTLKLDHIWKALIGEFSIQPAWFPSDCEQKAFILHRMSDHLCLSYRDCEESTGLQWKPDEDSCTVECSFSIIPLEDLDWMQKRRVVQLCHQANEGSIKVCQLFVICCAIYTPYMLFMVMNEYASYFLNN